MAERLANEAINAALASPQGQAAIRSGTPAKITYDVGYPVGMVLRQGDQLATQAQIITVILVPSNNPQTPGWVVNTFWLD